MLVMLCVSSLIMGGFLKLRLWYLKMGVKPHGYWEDLRDLFPLISLETSIASFA